MAWIIDYNYGRPQNHNESYDYYVRLVRSTKSFDIYTANLEKIKPREGEILAAQNNGMSKLWRQKSNEKSKF